MKQIFINFEIKKIIKRRFVQAALLLLLTVSIGLTVFSLRSYEPTGYGARRALYDKYKQDRESVMSDYTAMQEFFAERMERENEAFLLGIPFSDEQWENRYGSEEYGDAALFAELFAREEFINGGYRQMITELCREANTAMVQNAGADEYLDKYQISVIRKYDRAVSGTELKLDYPYGWSAWFDLGNIGLPVFLAAIVIAVGAYGFERDGRQLLRTCKYGKTSAGTAKLFAAITLAVAAAFVFSALSLAAILIYGGGIGDAGNAIQSLESYKYCPYTLTIAQAALLAMIMRCAAAAALTCVFAVLCRILSEPITSFAACAAALGGVYALDASGTFISHTGIIAFAGGEPFLMRYRAYKLFGSPTAVSTLAVIFVLAVPVMCAFFVLITDREWRQGAVKTFDFGARIKRIRIKLPVREKRNARRGLLCWEARKLLKQRAAAMAMLVLLTANAYFAYDSVTADNSLQEEIYREYTVAYAGKVTDEKIKALEAELTEFSKTISLESYRREEYSSGSVSAEEYKQYLSDLYKAKTHSSPAGRMLEQMRAIYGSEGEIIYDSGAKLLLRGKRRVFAFLLAAIAGCFTAYTEYRGIDVFANVLHGCKRRAAAYSAKAALVFIISSVACIASAAAECIAVVIRYGIPNMLVPINSVGGFTGGYPIIMGYLFRCASAALLTACSGIAAGGLFVLAARIKKGR